MLCGDTPEPYDVLVAQLDLASPSQASNLLITAKRMFVRHLHRVIAETVDTPANVEDELRELQKNL